MLSVDDSNFFSSSYPWYIGHMYWVMDGCSAIIFVKHILVYQTVFVQVLSLCSHSTHLHNAVQMHELIVALLWKLLQMPSCSANNSNLSKNNDAMFYKIDCCAATHGRIWMNNVPNESRIIMLSCAEISFVKFFDFEKFGSHPRVSFFFFFTHTVELSSIEFTFLFNFQILQS